MLAMLIASGGGSITDVNGWTLLWAWVTFLVTFYCLSKIAWPMLQAKMEEREVRIADGLKKAAEAEARALELMEKQEFILDETRAEAQKLLADSRSAAENIKTETVEAAQREIAAERERARREIELERKKAVAELKAAVVDLTLDAAGRILERELKDEDHRKMAAEVIGQVERLR